MENFEKGVLLGTGNLGVLVVVLRLQFISCFLIRTQRWLGLCRTVLLCRLVAELFCEALERRNDVVLNHSPFHHPIENDPHEPEKEDCDEHRPDLPHSGLFDEVVPSFLNAFANVVEPAGIHSALL